MDNETEFFIKVKNGTIPRLEINNTVEFITSNFQVKKLKTLLEDFEWYLLKAKSERRDACTKEEIEDAINVLKNTHEPLPYLSHREKIMDVSGTVIVDEKATKVLDLERLCFPNEFNNCEVFLKSLRTEIKKRERTNISHIEDKPNNLEKGKLEALTAGNGLTENPYPRIFQDINCFNFFESLKGDIQEQYQLAYFSFYYRRMQQDGYIFKGVSDTEFRDFLQEEYDIIIDKTKGLAYCTTVPKESHYKAQKKLFQLPSK